MLQEFKEFAVRGNVVDMAVGIIVGAAFGTVVNSMAPAEQKLLAEIRDLLRAQQV